MTGPANISKIDSLRARDGDLCWLCLDPIDFRPEPKKTRRPTLEHLHPKSLGGTDELTNLRLCHPGCNRQLADRPRTDKERIRAKRVRKLEVKMKPLVSAAPTPANPMMNPIRIEGDGGPKKLRRALLIAVAAATFFAGLALGLLVTR
jgi:hypothetical protein